MKLKVYPDERPKTRGECYGMPRPCPFVSCRYHLAHGELQPKNKSGRAIKVAHDDAVRLMEEYPDIHSASLATGIHRDAINRALKTPPPDVEESAEYVAAMDHSCALDVADSGELGSDEVAVLMHVTRSMVSTTIRSLRSRLETELDASDLAHLVGAYDSEEFDQWSHDGS